jgi:dsRNA-specific ribonuclease
VFTVELSVGDMTTTGVGRSKKLAEKSAAEKALKQLSDRER